MTISAHDVRTLLQPFGPLRPQPPSEWRGEIPLPAALASFYEEVGPIWIDIPTLGNPFWLPPLAHVWERQSGYRWHGISGERLPEWQDHWLVVADQGGDPFILNLNDGMILTAEHGQGGWDPRPLFANLLTMAAALGTIGAVHEEAGEALFTDDWEPKPEWGARLVERLSPLLGRREAETVADHFGWLSPS